MTTAETAYREDFIITDEATGQDVYEFRCNICGNPTIDTPCPDHAPRDVPGLRLVDCTAEGALHRLADWLSAAAGEAELIGAEPRALLFATALLTEPDDEGGRSVCPEPEGAA